jgi:hypothetical protein
MECTLRGAWSHAGTMAIALVIACGDATLAHAEFSSLGYDEMPGLSSMEERLSIMSTPSPAPTTACESTCSAPKTSQPMCSGERSDLTNSDGDGERPRRRGATGCGAALWLDSPECRLEMRAEGRLHRLGPFLKRLRARLRRQLVEHRESLNEHQHIQAQ